MPNPPTGTVTFLFTDIEGSTALALAQPDGLRRRMRSGGLIIQVGRSPVAGFEQEGRARLTPAERHAGASLPLRIEDHC